MQDAIHENVKQVLVNFDHFVNLYETESWIEISTLQAIRCAFQIATFLEERVTIFKKNGCYDNFIDVLNIWWKTKNRTHVYHSEFYALASDRLLSLFFTNSSTCGNKLDEAVKVYTQMFSQERFQMFVERQLVESRAYSAIVDLTTALESEIDLKCKLLLNNWCLEVACGRQNGVEQYISQLLSGYKIEKTLPLLLQILVLPENMTEKVNYIQKELLLKPLLLRMSDRSALIKNLWLCLFFNIDKCYLIHACEKYSDFFEELVNFIFYIGGMMKLDSSLKWIGDTELSICPELSYGQLVSFARALCSHNLGFRNHIESKVDDAKMNNIYLFWSDFENDVLQ